MPRTVVPLKDSQCRSAKPREKAWKLFDGGGLYLEVMPTGAKGWRYKFSHAGKESRLSFGPYPALPLVEARQMRDEHRALVIGKINPANHRRVEKIKARESASNSFKSVALAMIESQRASWSVVHHKKVARALEKDVYPYIGTRPLAEIDPTEVLACIKKVEARSAHETAHRLLTNCSQVFRYGVAHGIVKSDPTRDLIGALKPVEHAHLAAITDKDGVTQLMRAIDSFRGTAVVTAALKLTPLLFQRPGEVRRMQWNEVDLGAAEWRYFVTKTKSDHIVPLSVQTIEILRELQPLTDRPMPEKPDAPNYVFPGGRSRMRPMSENAVRAALQSLGYGGDVMTPHGFRATARTMLHEELGWNPDAIERQLAHKVRGPLGAAYDRTQFLAERRKMMQAWADYLDALKRGADVIPLHSRAAA
ncbi:MAG: integrase arm-type DNA-binding domain-containing protein [Pseudomonadota bacterium]